MSQCETGSALLVRGAEQQTIHPGNKHSTDIGWMTVSAQEEI